MGRRGPVPGTMPPDKIMRSTELLGAQVAPVVRRRRRGLHQHPMAVRLRNNFTTKARRTTKRQQGHKGDVESEYSFVTFVLCAFVVK